MASLSGLLGLARDGMVAQQSALSVTGDNITNATTPGYVRRTAVLQAQGTQQGQPGGVLFAGITRSYDQFAEQSVLDETGKQSAADARTGALTQLQGLVAPGGTATIPAKVNSLMDAFNQLVGYPGDLTVRQDVVAKATDLAQSISSTAKGITSQAADLVTQAQGVADEVNQRLTQIAALNGQIAISQASGDPAAGLQDQRGVLVGEVASRIGAHAVQGTDGTYTLMGAGAALVDGTSAAKLSVDLDTSGALRVQVVHPGGSQTDVTTNVVSGTLGGIREARDQDLPAASQQLDQFAYDLSNAINTAQSAGYGLDGVTGRAMFTAPAAVAGAAASMAVDPSVATDPSAIAAASTATDVPGGNGNAVALLDVGQNPIGAGGTPAERVAGLTSSVGVSLAAAQGEQTLRQSTVAQATTLRDSASGVSVDEEMVKLTSFQRAFQASVQVLQTADQLMQSLLTMVQAG